MNNRKKWSWRKRLLLSLLATMGLAVAAISIFIASEWTFIQRFWYFKKELPTPPEWYEPRQIVRGAPRPRDLPSANAAAVGISTNALQKALEKAIAGNALSFLVLKNGALVTEYYAAGHGPHRWTDSASMMKTVTALLIGIAITEGQIHSVDDPASLYFPPWARDQRKEITIKNLLQMHSGLRPEGEYEDPFSDACYLALGTDARYVVENCPLTEKTGSRFDYNNINFEALGLILQNATKRPFSEFMSEKLWAPLGNSNAALWLDHTDGVPRTFGFCFATARDWARLGQLILDRDKIDDRQLVPAAWIDFMCSPSPHEPTYGAGLYIAVDNAEDPPFAYAGIVDLRACH